MIICEGHWDMVYRNAVRLWVQKGIFVQMRRVSLDERCDCCEHYQVSAIGIRAA